MPQFSCMAGLDPHSCAKYWILVEKYIDYNLWAWLTTWQFQLIMFLLAARNFMSCFWWFSLLLFLLDKKKKGDTFFYWNCLLNFQRIIVNNENNAVNKIPTVQVNDLSNAVAIKNPLLLLTQILLVIFMSDTYG